MNPCRLALFLLLLTLLPGMAVADPPAPPAAKERCAVCGMLVAPYPNWLATIVFQDGSQAFFDGPKDMFVFYFGLENYRPQGKAADIAAMYVTEYYSTRQLPAEEVFFIAGSDILGPMGSEMVPVEGMENAQTLLRDHGGTTIRRFVNGRFEDVYTAP